MLPFQVLDAGGTGAARIEQQTVIEEPHEDRAHLPARCDQSAAELGDRGLFLEVEDLRVELSREVDDVLPGDRHIRQVENLADLEILEISLGHEGSGRGEKGRGD